MTTIRKIILGTALAASAVTVAAPASARDYYGHRGNNGAAVAIGAGVIGLALGAVLASSSHHRDYDDYRYRNARHHHDRRDDYRGSYGRYDNRAYGNGYNGGGYYQGYNSGYNGNWGY